MSKHSLLSLLVGCAIGAAIAILSLQGLRSAGPDAADPRSGDDPTARVHETLASTDPLRRVTEFAALLPTVDPSAAKAIADTFETTPVDGGDPELVVFGMWWAQHDPQAAFAWATAEWRARQANVLAAIVRVWAHRDPKSALTAARGLAVENQRDAASDGAISGWDESGQPGLLEVLKQFNNIEAQKTCEVIARRRVVALGAEGALRWVDSLGDNPYREILTVRVASAAAANRNGARVAGEWARPRVSSGTDAPLSNLPRRIATRWIHHDPAGAMAWLASLPAGNDRDDGVAEAYRTWLRRDPAAAHSWVEKLDIQPWNEPALAIYARAVAYDRPKEAIELARKISNESWRESTTVVVGQVWAAKDFAAAQAWMNQTPDLPEHTRRTALMAHNTNPANAERMERFRNRPPDPPPQH